MNMTIRGSLPQRNNFYISYHEDDRQWAKWIEWCVNDIGYSTSSFNSGIRFKRNIQDEKDVTSQNATSTIVVLSQSYLKAFQTSDWVEVFGRDRLLPVMVRDCPVKGVFGPRDYINLTGADIDARKAYDILSEGIQNWGMRHSDAFSVPPRDRERSEHVLYYTPAYPGGLAAVQSANAGAGSLALWESRDPLHEPDNDKYSYLESEALAIDATILGREGVVDDIYRELTGSNTTALSLTGIGGAGKSMLASLVCRKVEESLKSNQGPFAAKPVWLAINEEVTLIDLAGNLFKAIDQPFRDFQKHSPRYQAKLLIDALKGADKPLLIILDPFEKILDLQTGQLQMDRQEIAEWLDLLKSQFCVCKVLLTSRLHPLGNRNNPGATFLKEHPIPVLSETEAIELLSKLGVKEPEETKEDLCTAITRCDNHPYALKLLADVLKTTSLKQLLQDPSLWDDNVAKNLLNRIYNEQLNPVQQMVLLAFSIYRKDVPLEAAEAVLRDELQSGKLKSADVRNAFNVLLIQHLLQATGGGRCRLHAIVKNYAHNHFDTGDQANEQAKKAAHAKGASYYYKKYEQGGDVGDMVEAIWHYCQAGQQRIAYTFLSEGRNYDQIKHWGGHSTLLQLYKLLLPLNKWLLLPKEIYTAAKIYSILGDLYYALGQKQPALQRYKDALQHFKQMGEEGEEAAILKKMGTLYEDMGDSEQARQCYEQALAIFKQAGEREEEGTVLASLGRVLRKQGKKVEARQYLEQALAIFKASGEHLSRGQMLKLLGEISYEMGMNGDAQQHFDEALIIFGQEKDPAGEGETLNNLGLLYMATGRIEDAERSLAQALAVHTRVRNREMEGVTLSNLGGVYKIRGDQQEAIDATMKALNIHKEIGNPGGVGVALNNLGVIYNDLPGVAEATQHYEEARQHYKEAYDTLKNAGKRWETGRTLYNIGAFYIKQPKSKAVVLACLFLAKRIFEETQSPDLALVVAAMDRFAQDIGKKEYSRLLALCEQNAQGIVEQALRDI